MPVSFSFAALLYLAIMLGAIGIVAIISNLQSYFRAPKESRRLFVCEYCHYSYLEDREKQVTSCPRCSLMNKANMYKNEKKRPTLLAIIQSALKK